MKKVLSIISIFLLGLVLIACEQTEVIDNTDPSQGKLQEAYNTLGAFIADPSNITDSFTVLATLKGGVSATWESSETGVISFGAADSTGSIVANVNRPGKGQGNAKVTITATLSIKATNSDETLTKVWSIEVTVVESSVEALEINNVADILAIKDAAYDATLQVTLSDMTIIAKSAGEAFAYDGTGIIQLYGGVSGTLEVGKVYTVSGTIDWYFGIWEFTKVTAVEQVGATPKQAPKETITNVSGKINALLADGQNVPANGAVADGNFEPIYATVTGKVMYDTATTGNYNTYIVNTDLDVATWKYGTAEAPAQGLLVYYQTSDFNLVRLYAGLEVTMDVVIYTYRSNNQAFAIYYVGGPAGIQANLSDEDTVNVGASSLQVPAMVAEAATVAFPTVGPNGSSIAWSYKSQTNANNSLVNLTTGAISLPASGQVEVTVVAVVTKGEASKTVEFTIKIGQLQTVAVNQVYAYVKGDKVKTQGTVLGFNGNNQITIVDETGAITLYDTSKVEALKALIGKVVLVEGTKDIYNGLHQIGSLTITEVKDATPFVPTPADLLAIELWNAETLLAHQGNLVSAQSLLVSNFAIAGNGTVTMTLTDVATGRSLNFRWDYRVTLDDVTYLNSIKNGDYVNLVGAIVGWSNGPQVAIFKGNQIQAGTAPVLTDAQVVAKVKNELTLVAETNKSIVLPTSAEGATIAWASSDAAIIAVDGTFTAPAETTEVTLTATITKGEAVETKEFKVSALGAGNVEPLLIATFDFGTAAKTGYAAGSINFLAGTETININKDRAQINTSGNAPFTDLGAFLVLAPIATAKDSFAEFDFSDAKYANITKIEFSIAAWTQSAVDTIKSGDAAYLGLEMLVGEAWVKVDTNKLSALTANQLTTVSFAVTGAGKYRIVYSAPNTTATGNTAIAICIDDMKLFS